MATSTAQPEPKAVEQVPSATSDAVPLRTSLAVGAPGGAVITGTALAPAPPPAASPRRTFMERVEAFISKLSTRNNFWHRVCSMIWLPYAFRSGIQMRRLDGTTFTAVLPFRRFNKNWYNAMAGAALLGNSEIAGGMYVFSAVGKDYTVVCKELTYRFLRPCFGPAIYRVTPKQDIQALIATGNEFNIDIQLDIVQQQTVAGMKLPGAGDLPPKGREKRVGRCLATFHVTPKSHHKLKRLREQGVPGEVAGAEQA
ncbi:MAG: PaaI family thioesterase [Phycisphaerales bacterium]